MLVAFVTALLFAPTTDAPVIAPDQAKDHVGQEVVVQGQVAQIGASERSHTLFVNFGGRYPNHVFTAVIFSRNLQASPQGPLLGGQDHQGPWAGPGLQTLVSTRMQRTRPGQAAASQLDALFDGPWGEWEERR
jgi:hypothetical protein